MRILTAIYIIKRRAYRYIAGAKKEWLYPEPYVSTDHWRKLGDGYLLMPEPRLIHMSGEILIGYTNGHSEAFNEYGHKPWQKGYNNAARERRETQHCIAFKQNGQCYAAHATQQKILASCANTTAKMTRKIWPVIARS
jgi:hypothetical protein